MANLTDLNDYLSAFTTNGFEIEDQAESIKDYVIARRQSDLAIKQAANEAISTSKSKAEIYSDIETQYGFGISNRNIALTDGSLVTVDDFLSAIITVRDDSTIDDVDLTNSASQTIKLSDVINEMAVITYSDDALQSSLEAISSTSPDASGADIANSFLSLLSNVNDSTGGVFQGIKNVYTNILSNKNLSKMEKLSGIIEQFNFENTYYDSTTGLYNYDKHGIAQYTGIAPCVSWLSNINVTFRASEFVAYGIRIVAAIVAVGAKIIETTGNLFFNLTKWLIQTYKTGENFKINTLYTENLIDIPVCSRIIPMDDLLDSVAHVTFDGASTYETNLVNGVNAYLNSGLLSREQTAEVIRDLVPLKGTGYLTIPCKVGKIIMCRAYDTIDVSTLIEVIIYQVFISPSNTHTNIGNEVYYSAQTVENTVNSTNSFKELAESLFSGDFLSAEITDDHSACECIRASLYRLNLWTLLLAASPSIVNEYWFSHRSFNKNTNASYFQAAKYLGGDMAVTNLGGKHLSGYLYSFDGLTTNSPLSGPPLTPTNAQIVSMITNSLNYGGYVNDRFLATIMKHLILTSNYVLNNCEYDSGVSPTIIPHYISSGMSTRFHYSVATDDQNKQTFTNYLTKIAVVGAIVGVAVVYMKFKLWGAGLVATYSGRYTASLVALSKLTPGTTAYQNQLASVISSRKKLQWVSLLSSLIGGYATVPNVLDRTISSITDLGSTSNNEVIKEIRNTQDLIR